MDTYDPWGQSVAINLFDCDISTITNPEIIQQYVTEVIKEIGMIAHGPLHIERFGNPDIHPGPGYSALQFIETSSITIHCDEPGKRCFVDIFSCSNFDSTRAVAFTKKFFHAKREQSVTLMR